jgi:hypothetical protein
VGIAGEHVDASPVTLRFVHVLAESLVFAALAVQRSGAIPFQPLPEQTRQQCLLVQAHAPFTVFCPRRVPRPTQGWRPGSPPAPWHSDVLGSPRHPRLKTPYGIELGYSAPVEPVAGYDWKRTLWHNRPCCFLHFTIWVPTGALPRGRRPARLGGKLGSLLLARGYGLRGTQGIYWSNHTWFFWQAHGTRYVASLHYFGPGTTTLLGHLIANLRPARSLVRR